VIEIVHVSAVDRRGGAGLATYRLHQALRRKGVASRMLVREKISQDDSVRELPPAGGSDPTRRQGVEAVEYVYRDRNRSDLSNTHFSLSLQGQDLSDCPTVRAADLVHLHWVASVQTPASVRRLLGLNKPIVWTLHDLGPFTGGCHFPAGCRHFEDSCSGCPQLLSDPFGLPAAVLRDKKDLWPTSAFTLAAPSRWMADQVRKSALFGSTSRLKVIPNGVDTQVFRPRPQAEARAALGLPLSGNYVLCGADQAQENRKGFGPLGRVLDRCVRDPLFRSADVPILHVGDLPAGWTGKDWPLLSLGRVAEETRMALAYAAADLFVLPSLEDNLPNMMLEALSCGRPVVAFAVGGVPEIVRDGWNGRLVPAGDETALAQAILSLAKDPESRTRMGRNGRALIEAQYSGERQAEAYLSLYEEALADTAGRDVTSRRPAGQHAPDGASGEHADPGPAVAALLPRLTVHCLYQAWRTAEEDRVARGTVIRELQRHVQSLEERCAVPPPAIQAAEALQQQKADPGHRFQAWRPLGRAVSALARLRRLRSD
jgi:glycosyltransferase involved in cell wall biosynthesis